MISDRQLVLAASAAYDASSIAIIDAVEHAVRVFRTEVDGLTVIAIEGTHDPIGWVIDFFAIKATDHEMLDHPSLGMVHAGFQDAADAVINDLTLAVQGIDYAICGHSLGGELALHLGAMMIDNGHPPVKIGAFAPPRGGGAQFVSIATSVPFCAYRFGNDIVPLVPLTIPDFPWAQVPLTEVGIDAFDPLEAHKIANYVAAIQ